MDEPEKGPGEDDRREHERNPIELKVEYRRLNAFFADYTRNISKGGTFIATSKPLDIGTEFVFKLYVPHLDDALRIRGKVRWIVSVEEAERKKDPLGPGMGIRFVYRDDEERGNIEKLVERLMVGSLGRLLTSKLMSHRERGEDKGDE
jgi:type IV pilus assembly protein PilZ